MFIFKKKHIAMNNGQKPFELLHVTLTFMDISKYRLIAAIVESRIYVFRFVKTFEMEGVPDQIRRTNMFALCTLKLKR